MHAPKLTICVIDNGIKSFLERTLNSLDKQTVKSFSREILDFQNFWSPDRNCQSFGADYVLFLYSGSCLEKDAVEQICDLIEKKAPVWFYFDEKTYDAEINADPYGFLEKPDFDALAFAQDVYTGEGVVFSKECLNRMELQYEGNNFAAALTEMSIAAAMQSEPLHLRTCLLLRHNKPPVYTRKREMLTARLKEYMERCTEGMTVRSETSRIGLQLIPQQKKTDNLSVVLLMDEKAVSDAFGFADLREAVEIIPVTDSVSYLEKCLLGARKATGDFLCFLDPEYVQCSAADLMSLCTFANIPGTGLVSPRISAEGMECYIGCCGPAGEQISIPEADCNDKELEKNLQTVRQTSLPAWQCWMVEKKLFLQIMDAVMDIPGVGNYPKAYVLLECAMRANALGRKNLYVGAVSLKGKSVRKEDSCTGFVSMISRQKDAFFQDRFCPTRLNGYLVQRGLKQVKAYFPEHMPEYSPETRKMLVLTHELSLTGAPVVLSHAVHILQEENIQVVVISPEDGPLRNTFLREKVPVIIRGDMDQNEEWLRWAGEFDLVLVNTVVPFRQIQQLGKIRIPVMWWLHDARSGYEDHLRYILPETVSENISIYSVSKYADDAMKRYRPKYRSGLLFYGLQDKRMDQPDSVKAIEGAEGKKVFISVGTVIRRKGQDILAEAVRKLPDPVRKQCLFLFIGKCIDQDIFDQVKELERDYPEEVRQIDAVPHDEIFGLYRQAAAVICSSRDDPLPTFMAETMMVSGVCICSENTGTASVIRHGVNGFLYEKDSPENLARCIWQVVKNDNMDTIKAESRKTFEQYFTMDIFRKNLMKCVEDSISHASEGESK